MKNDFITWVYIGGFFVSNYCSIWPPFDLNWLSYIFLCLMIAFLLLIIKRAGRLTRKVIIAAIFCCIIGCLFYYFLGRLTHTS